MGAHAAGHAGKALNGRLPVIVALGKQFLPVIVIVTCITLIIIHQTQLDPYFLSQILVTVLTLQMPITLKFLPQTHCFWDLNSQLDTVIRVTSITIKTVIGILVSVATFYPNGGNRQPGCEGEVGGVCSHAIAAQFMAESIHPQRTFGAIRCQNFEAMRNNSCISSGPSRQMGGEPVVDGTSPPGSVYFLQTNPTSPFSQGPR